MSDYLFSPSQLRNRVPDMPTVRTPPVDPSRQGAVPRRTQNPSGPTHVVREGHQPEDRSSAPQPGEEEGRDQSHSFDYDEFDAVLPMNVEVESLHERSMFARREEEEDDEGDEPVQGATGGHDDGEHQAAAPCDAPPSYSQALMSDTRDQDTDNEARERYRRELREENRRLWDQIPARPSDPTTSGRSAGRGQAAQAPASTRRSPAPAVPLLRAACFRSQPAAPARAAVQVRHQSAPPRQQHQQPVPQYAGYAGQEQSRQSGGHGVQPPPVVHRQDDQDQHRSAFNLYGQVPHQAQRPLISSYLPLHASQQPNYGQMDQQRGGQYVSMPAPQPIQQQAAQVPAYQQAAYVHGYQPAAQAFAGADQGYRMAAPVAAQVPAYQPDPVVQQQPRLQMSQPQYGHPLFRTICNAVPTFDGMPGSNVDTWIVSYDRLTRDLTAMERQLILFERIRGRAATWFQDQQAADRSRGVETTVEMWLTRLQSQFTLSHSIRRTDLSRRTQLKGETPILFCGDLKHLLTVYDSNMREAEQVDWLRKLMYPDYRRTFDLKCPSNASWTQAVECLGQAMEFVSNHGTDTATTAPVPPPPQPIVPAPVQVPVPALPQIPAPIPVPLPAANLYAPHGLLPAPADPRYGMMQAEMDNLRAQMSQMLVARDNRQQRVSFYDDRTRQRREPSPDDRHRHRQRDLTPGRDRDRRTSPSDGRARSRSPGGRLVCYQCDGRGHRKSDCPSNPQSRNFVPEPRYSRSPTPTGNQGNE